jgi:hypothetical protein
MAATALALATVIVSASAMAARQPTLRERAAITEALPTEVQRYPIGCVYLRIAVSTNPRFAKVVPEVFYPARESCLRYAANGWYILKKTTRWRIIFNGSDQPSCSLRIPRDLLAPLGCTR